MPSYRLLFQPYSESSLMCWQDNTLQECLPLHRGKTGAVQWGLQKAAEQLLKLIYPFAPSHCLAYQQIWLLLIWQAMALGTVAVLAYTTVTH